MDLVAEALNAFIQRAKPFGDHLDLRPQAFGDHIEMAASLCGAGLDVLAEFLAEVLSKPIEPGVERVLGHG
jgi:hypothetical protein